jgi:hypothetical protein
MEFRKYFNLESSITLLIASLVFALAFWYQISPITFNQYKSICSSNYGNSPKYTDCMNPYWSQYQLGYTLALICGSLALLSLISCLYFYLKTSR